MDSKIFRLTTDYNERGPFGPIGKALNDIGRLLNGLHFADGGSVLTTSQFIRLRSSGQGQSFSGVAYVAGTKITGLNSDASKPWIMIDFAAVTATEVTTAEVMFPFPPNIECYEKSKTFGDIHVLRA